MTHAGLPLRRARRRPEQGRRDILQAAAHLLSTNGYHGMTMRDLSRATGMSLANLYNYFSSKEDVAFALQTRAFETLLSSAEEATGVVEGGAARLHAFILSHVRYVANHREVMRVLVEEAGELSGPRRHAIRELKERYFRIGRRIVGSALGVGGRGARGRDAELDRATYAIFGMINWVYAWYDPAQHGTPHDVARSIHRVAMSGLGCESPSRASQTSTERMVAKVRVHSPIRQRSEDVA